MNITLTAETQDTDMSVQVGRRARWVKAIKATVGPLEVTERSQGAARQKLTETVEQLLDVLRDPEFITHNGKTLVLYISTLGGVPTFGYRVIGITSGAISPTGETWDQARRSALRHFLDLATDPHDDESVAGGVAFIRSQRGTDDDVADFLRRAAWQRAAKAAIDAGEADYHRWACDHEREFFASVGYAA